MVQILDKDVEELKGIINSVEPEFKKLKDIGHRFNEQMNNTCDRQTKSVADSAKEYILNLGNTFESDFVRYQPDLGFLDFLQSNKREEFNAAFQKAFIRYLNEKMSEWERGAEKQLKETFAQLAQSAAEYGEVYNQVVVEIEEKLTGNKININKYLDNNEDSPGWAKWAMGFFSLATGNVGGIALAAAGFDWKNILVNWLAVVGISSFLLIFTGVTGVFVYSTGNCLNEFRNWCFTSHPSASTIP